MKEEEGISSTKKKMEKRHQRREKRQEFADNKERRIKDDRRRREKTRGNEYTLQEKEENPRVLAAVNSIMDRCSLSLFFFVILSSLESKRKRKK